MGFVKAKFATVFNCMDGRTQLPVNEHLREKLGVDYVDTITEAGVDRLLAERTEETVLAAMRKRLDISVNAHGSRACALVAHHDCAGNPVDRPRHMEQLKAASATLREWMPEGEILLLWVDENWTVHEVAP